MNCSALVDTQEAARILAVHQSNISRRVAAKTLTPAFRLGVAHLFWRSDVEALARLADGRPDPYPASDFAWIAKQMHVEAEGILAAPEGHACYWCKQDGPGLYWLPSEVGVIEMSIWSCESCIAHRDADT